MSWNYRVIKHDEGDEWYAIHEVYYEDDEPSNVTVEPVYPSGSTHEEFEQNLRYYMKALEKPSLNYEDFK